MDGGTGAETMGGAPLDTVRLCDVGPATTGDDDVLPVRENEAAGAGGDQGRARRVDERPAEEIGRTMARRRANPPFRPEPLNLFVELRPARWAGDGWTSWRDRARKSSSSRHAGRIGGDDGRAEHDDAVRAGLHHPSAFGQDIAARRDADVARQSKRRQRCAGRTGRPCAYW
jgi:hypothetical protein